MILTCPSCSTRYLIDPASLGVTGRAVRCARCSHTWTEVPPEDMAKRVDVLPPVDKVRPIPPGSNLPALQKSGAGKSWVGWAALVAVIVGLAGGAIMARDQIITAWPDAARLYAALGLDERAAVRGLEVRNVAQESFFEDDQRIVVLHGEIVNISGQSHDVPRVIIQVLDEAKKVIGSSYAMAADDELAPGATTVFSGRITDPPKSAVSLNVVLEGAEM